MTDKRTRLLNVGIDEAREPGKTYYFDCPNCNHKASVQWNAHTGQKYIRCEICNITVIG